MLKKTGVIILGVFLLASVTCFGQNSSNADGIHWMSITDAFQKMTTDSVKKKVFIDVYTQWCGWCKRMDATTYEDPGIIAYINSRYYPVKLDAEIKDTIHLGDKTFVYSPEDKVNGVAKALMNGKMSYPTIIYLDEQFNMLSPVPGYMSTLDLFPVLHYFGDNIYKTTSWEDFDKQVHHQ